MSTYTARMRGKSERRKYVVATTSNHFCAPTEVFEMLRGKNRYLNGERREPPSIFLLESGSNGRWSFIGIGKPTHALPARFSEPNFAHSSKQVVFHPNRAIIKKDRPPFIGGWVGFLSYDYGVRRIGISQTARDDLHCPNYFWLFCDRLVAIDHKKKRLIYMGVGDMVKSAREKSRQVEEKIARSKIIVHHKIHDIGPVKTGLFRSALTPKQYRAKIQKIKNHLRAGETYQVNFAQRFTSTLNGDPWAIYKAVSRRNPSPFQAYFETEDWAIISNSPEELVRGRMDENGVCHLSTRPIKGTVPRGKTAAKDNENIKQLLQSEKDTAELTMIVDLERNDFGRICIPGSVKVKRHRAIEKYSHVIHTVSEINGILQEDRRFEDVIKALFPGGSITGCPKRRTVEIINTLEKYKRGVYCGSAGYVSLDGNFDFNIMIRTLFAKKSPIVGKKYTLYLYSGGGIVMDSNPSREYEETMHKARAFFDVVSGIY